MKQFVTIGVLTVLLGIGCTPAAPDITIPLLQVDDMGATSINITVLESALEMSTTTKISPEEQAGILLMREEEKLARDVYTALYEQYGVQIFSNIAASEQTHTDSVGVLLDTFGINDPVTDMDTYGGFTNAELQAFYETLIADGSSDLVSALRVGALVEEVDIMDLERLLAETSHPDIITVYQNLLRGSRNHLRAFVRQIEQREETYIPVRLSEEQYATIVAGDVERGRR